MIRNASRADVDFDTSAMSPGYTECGCGNQEDPPDPSGPKCSHATCERRNSKASQAPGGQSASGDFYSGAAKSPMPEAALKKDRIPFWDTPIQAEGVNLLTAWKRATEHSRSHEIGEMLANIELELEARTPIHAGYSALVWLQSMYGARRDLLRSPASQKGNLMASCGCEGEGGLSKWVIDNWPYLALCCYVAEENFHLLAASPKTSTPCPPTPNFRYHWIWSPIFFRPTTPDDDELLDGCEISSRRVKKATMQSVPEPSLTSEDKNAETLDDVESVAVEKQSSEQITSGKQDVHWDPDEEYT
ncbi:hypothetical protein B0H13DRAFT_1924164 [Mycena leptocephala]|nr:hypothetical protein B0H13DRAFT_1924164 [Mycena leptocephala]